MSEEKDDLTPEEEMLVQCLKGQVLPKDQSTVGHCVPTEQLQRLEHFRGKLNMLTHLQERVLKTETVEAVDARSLETVVQALRDEIRIGMDTLGNQAESLSMDDMNRLLEALEKMLLGMAGIREKVIGCIEEQKKLDVRNAVAQLIAQGLVFKRIQIDDICFRIDENKEIHIC